MKDKRDVICTTANRYNKGMLWLLCFLTLTGLLVMQWKGIDILAALLVAVFFNLFCSVAYIQTWKSFVRRAPETLPKLYLASSAFRLMAAAITLLVYCVVNRTDVVAIKQFAIVFISYYVFMLIFDSLFFSAITRKGIS